MTHTHNYNETRNMKRSFLILIHLIVTHNDRAWRALLRASANVGLLAGIMMSNADVIALRVPAAGPGIK